MTDFQKPAGWEIMGKGAQDRVERQARARARNDGVTGIGPRELQPGDGVRSMTTWDGKTIPGRVWIVNGLIPAGQVTMITGNGGEGKSLLAAQLAIGAVTNTLWIGHRVKQVRTIYVHCEDDEEEMARRFDGVLKHQGLGFSDLDDLTTIDRDGADSSLLYEAFGNETTGRTTAFYERIFETVRSVGAELLILDSLYNFFGGNENIRSQVMEFIGALKRLGRSLGCAVVIVAHPGRAGMGKDGDGTSGSTAWHNAVRSRFYLHRRKHPSGDPAKKGPLILEHLKANYGPAAEPIELVWEQGRFVPVVAPDHPPAVRTIWSVKEDEPEMNL